MDCREIPFDALLSEVVDNRGRSCPTSESGIPLIATNCIRTDRLYPTYENIRYVSKHTYDTWFRGHPLPGDIIFVNKGTPGRVCLVPDPVDFVIAQDMVAVRADSRRVYPRFLFAALRSPEVQERIRQMHVGTMIPHFKKTDFERLTIPVPVHRKNQEFIGDAYFILSARIDLIYRTNRALEAAAAALFRSWFQDFDPVPAKAEGRRAMGVTDAVQAAMPSRFTESAEGILPEGWRLGRFDEIAHLVRDQVTPEDIPIGTPYIGLEQMPRQSIALATWDATERVDSAKSRYAQGDVLFGKLRPYFHKVGVAPNDGVCSTEIFVLRPVLPEWYGLLVFTASNREFVEYASAAAEGTRMPRVSWSYLARYTIALPSVQVAGQFTAMVRPFVDRIITNIYESRSLAALRDSILRQLLSGAFQLRDAERAIAAAV